MTVYKLSASMEQMLLDLLLTGNAYASRRGMSAHGGASRTWVSLCDKGLIERHTGSLTADGLTEANRIQAARNSK